MAVTAADLEADLLLVFGPYLEQVGLDATTKDGTNSSLRIAVRRAMAAAAADETTLDIAQFYTLWLLLARYRSVDQTKGATSMSLAKRMEWLQKMYDDLKAKLGVLVEEPTAGTSPGGPAHGLMRAGRFDACGNRIDLRGWARYAYGRCYPW